MVQGRTKSTCSRDIRWRALCNDNNSRLFLPRQVGSLGDGTPFSRATHRTGTLCSCVHVLITEYAAAGYVGGALGRAPGVAGAGFGALANSHLRRQIGQVFLLCSHVLMHIRWK